MKTFTTRVIAAVTAISLLSAVGTACAHESENVEKVVICHVPPGNPDNMHTIEVGEPAVDAHLAHGDMLSYCPGDPEIHAYDDTSTAAITPPVARPVRIYQLRSIQGS